MDEFEKSTAVEWQKKSEESAAMQRNATCKELWGVHAEMARFRSECARYWMGIDDDTDQLYS